MLPETMKATNPLPVMVIGPSMVKFPLTRNTTFSPAPTFHAPLVVTSPTV